LKKVVLIILIVISCFSTGFIFYDKNKLNLIDKDIDNYKLKINELNKNINNFNLEKEQVEKQIKENIDENKLKLYEVWERQNKYLDQSL